VFSALASKRECWVIMHRMIGQSNRRFQVEASSYVIQEDCSGEEKDREPPFSNTMQTRK